MIEDTIRFQQTHFRKSLDDGKVDITATRRWYDEAQQNHMHCGESHSQDDEAFSFASLVHGLTSQFTGFGGMCKFPIVFQYDWNRLQQLRGEVQNLIHLDLCCAMFKNLLVVQGQSITESTIEQFQSRLCSILGDSLKPSDYVEKIWQSSTDTIALELVRALYVVQGRSITAISPTEVAEVEHRLSQLFQGQYSELYDRLVNNIHEQLEKSIMAHAEKFQNLSTFAIAESQRKRKTEPSKHTRGLQPDVDDIAKRIAHIAVLNWGVYADIVYNTTDIPGSSRRPILAAPNSPGHRNRRRPAFSFHEQHVQESIARAMRKHEIG